MTQNLRSSTQMLIISSSPMRLASPSPASHHTTETHTATLPSSPGFSYPTSPCIPPLESCSLHWPMFSSPPSCTRCCLLVQRQHPAFPPSRRDSRRVASSSIPFASTCLLGEMQSPSSALWLSVPCLHSSKGGWCVRACCWGFLFTSRSTPSSSPCPSSSQSQSQRQRAAPREGAEGVGGQRLGYLQSSVTAGGGCLRHRQRRRV
mmetsp:Transcript_49205/g.119333  ORF Transcript_49205/g.119333 Transcript_49205/m.119333 type:complete len:205 (+) Transcript_49205:105-719(+)